MVRHTRLAVARCIYVTLCAAASLQSLAVDCPIWRNPRISAPEVPLNIDKVKGQLRAYKTGNYSADLAAVAGDALAYLRSQAGQVKNPAMVLDIDETALSNWPAIDSDDFGFIPDGSCDDPSRGPCGFTAWVKRGEATAIGSTLSLYRSAREMGVTVFFVTSRLEETREKTMANLRRVGYEGVDDEHLRMAKVKGPAQDFKTSARNEIAQNFTIIANMGDQESDLAGDFSGCTFKLPNPFYFIP